ncbi:MAG: MMPL family transporter, partial [Spirochaeta sp.]|nr:MMPL family transporter [Spirochaeta sp.]
VVGLMLMILFHSVAAGLISAIPLALSMIILFGLMGVFGIELNTATALLSSIMIGVGIDYTIHFLWRYREERRNGLDAAAGVRKTLTTTGRGIVFNALSVVIGFIVLFISNFMPIKFFGFLVVVSILSCLGGALVLIPAICIVFKPKFLERR